MREEFLAILEKITAKENIKINEPMSAHSTFKAGGSAKYFVLPQTADEFCEISAECSVREIPFKIVGNGSNILVKDEGYDGVIICAKKLNGISLDGNVITCETGVSMAKAANFALDNELTGLEFASGIPGTVGGALYMNAGAYGREISDVFDSAEIFVESGAGVYSRKIFGGSDMDFGYRRSALSKGAGIALKAAFRLDRGKYTDIKDYMIELNHKRAEKQPLDLPSAGSAFKRPEGYYAAKLIEDAGLKGYKVGGARISEKHAGFIVNAENATATDILSLVARVQETVFNKFGVALEPEFCVIG